MMAVLWLICPSPLLIAGATAKPENGKSAPNGTEWLFGENWLSFVENTSVRADRPMLKGAFKPVNGLITKDKNATPLKL